MLGFWPVALVLLRAYSMGGGTYTGIEAVSNGITMLREPRVKTGKRTMFLMAASLALTAGGILFGYLLVGAREQARQDDELRPVRRHPRCVPARAASPSARSS